MRIAQISDTHILPRSSDDATGTRRAENLRRCIADINEQAVDAVIHTGDSVHGGEAEAYAHLGEILAGLEAPLFMVPGNRDRREALRGVFAHAARLPAKDEFLHYAVEDHPVRLVAIDSVAAGDRKGSFCAARHAWLEETLAQAPDRPTLLFIHHPPFDIPENHYVGGYRHPEQATDLTALVGRHAQVKQLFCGHVHALHRAPWAGTVATVMPSVAVDLRIGDGAPAEPSYLLHTVSPQGEVTSRTRIATG
jgi:3',5'-cyclic AMP phosphodiesterase CpdA